MILAFRGGLQCSGPSKKNRKRRTGCIADMEYVSNAQTERTKWLAPVLAGPSKSDQTSTRRLQLLPWPGRGRRFTTPIYLSQIVKVVWDGREQGFELY